jgi:hypothetical protein
LNGYRDHFCSAFAHSCSNSDYQAAVCLGNLRDHRRRHSGVAFAHYMAHAGHRQPGGLRATVKEFGECCPSNDIFKENPCRTMISKNNDTCNENSGDTWVCYEIIIIWATLSNFYVRV